MNQKTVIYPELALGPNESTPTRISSIISCAWFTQSARSITVALLVIGAIAAPAASLSVQTPSSTVPEGSSVQVDLDISGLAFAGAPSLGTFDLNLTYNSSILSLKTVTFGDPGLGDQLGLGGVQPMQSYDSSVPGTVNLFELSLNSASDLDQLQADSFRLVELTFSGDALGFSPLHLVVNALGDSQGASLAATLGDGGVTVSLASPVPDRGVGRLPFALCIVALFGSRRIRQSMA